MERIMKQMSTVSEKLNVAKISSNIKAIKQVGMTAPRAGTQSDGEVDAVGAVMLSET